MISYHILKIIHLSDIVVAGVWKDGTAMLGL